MAEATIARFAGLRQIELVHRSLPEPKRNQVRLQILQAAVCGSELDVFFSEEFWATNPTPDQIPPLGHEAVGIVEAVGQDVTDLRVGDRVVPWFERGFTLEGPDTRPNGFATHAILEAEDCVKVINNYAVVLEPIGCMVNAMTNARPILGDHVAIVGTGFLGRVLVPMSWMAGAATVTVVGRRAGPLRHVKELDMRTQVVDSSIDDVREAFRHTVGRDGADVVYECTGVPAGHKTAQMLVRRGSFHQNGGELSYVGYPRFGVQEIELGRICDGAIGVPRAHTRDQRLAVRGIERAARLLEWGRLDLSSFEFPDFAFDKNGIEAAFHTAGGRSSDRFGRAVVQISR
jgi:threonine dehydrogenase-like Zn-dependent dehydrogenase